MNNIADMPAPSVLEMAGGAGNAMPKPPMFTSIADERLYRKQQLAGAFRVFSRLGFDEGAAGHITVRDPEFPSTFWVNPFGVHFSQIKVSNLLRVDHYGHIVEGKHPLNTAAFAIHSRIHEARPDVLAAAHTHAPAGRAFAALGRTLEMINQDVCAFYQDHVLYDDYGGVVLELDEGARIAAALGQKKAAILRNHGLLTVGQSVGAAAWFYVSMERSCQVQMTAMAAAQGSPLRQVPQAACEQAYSVVGSEYSGWFQFQMLYARALKDNPDFLD